MTMSFPPRLVCTVIFLTLAIPLSAADQKSPDASRVVRLRVVTQDFDYYSPWQRKGHEIQWLHGAVLDTENGLIVTIAHPLHNTIFIEAVKFGEQRRFPATILLVDYNLGLALVTVADRSFWRELSPVTLPGGDYIPEKGVVAKWDAQDIYKTWPAELQKTAIQTYDSFGVALFHEMATGLDVGGTGEPVLSDGKLCGLTAWHSPERKLIKVNSYRTIRWMLSCRARGSYAGQPLFSAVTIPLRGDDNLRAYYRLSEEETGLIVSSVPRSSSGYGVLKREDIITAIDGIAIDDSGYCATAFGSLNWLWLISLNHFPGDALTMTILRSGTKTAVNFPLQGFTGDSFFIPTLYGERRPSYYIAAGLVFQELTQGYMNIWGGEWRKKADRRLAYFTDGYWAFPQEGRRRLVILSRVLPDEANAGYQSAENLILESVNNEKVPDLQGLWKRIENDTDPVVVFAFSEGTKMILTRESIRRATPGILRNYGITSPHNLDE